jgi:hypothetical protein
MSIELSSRISIDGGGRVGVVWFEMRSGGDEGVRERERERERRSASYIDGGSVLCMAASGGGGCCSGQR